MTSITYYFEELQPFKKLAVLANGHAEITGTAQSAEPDVGIMHGYYEYDVESIYVNGYELGDPDSTQITKDHPLYQPIMDALYSDYHESRICEELAENESSGEDDDAYDRYRDEGL